MNEVTDPEIELARLNEIRARLHAATPGPWACRSDEVPSGLAASRSPEKDLLQCRQVFCVPCSDADAAFIAHARADIPWLLKRLGAVGDATVLREAVEKIKTEAANIRSDARRAFGCESLTVALFCDGMERAVLILEANLVSGDGHAEISDNAAVETQPTLLSLRGVAPRATGDLSAAEFLYEQRAAKDAIPDCACGRCRLDDPMAHAASTEDKRWGFVQGFRARKQMQ